MNSQHVSGLSVISIAAGEKLGSVGDVFLDAEGKKVIAMTVTNGGGGLLSSGSATSQLLDAGEIRSIGPDALTVQDDSCLSDAEPDPEWLDLAAVLKHKVVTEGGVYVGQVASLDFDEQDMTVTHLEASPGFFKSNMKIPAKHIVNLGHDLVMVADEVCASQEEEPAEPAEPEQSRWVVGDVTPRETKPEPSA